MSETPIHDDLAAETLSREIEEERFRDWWGCPDCNGTGVAAGAICAWCDGSGVAG